MAVQGSGLGKGPDRDMKDQTGFNARSGAAKQVQTSFDVHPGMKDQTRAMSGSGPANPGSGPDAVGKQPHDLLSAAERGKSKPEALKSSWGMKDANGQGVDADIGGKVIGEAILSGSAKLPDDPAYSKGSPKRPG